MTNKYNNSFNSKLNFKIKALILIMFSLITVQSFAALNMAVEVTSSPSIAGEMIIVRLTVTNPSATTANNTRIEMPYPDNLASLFNLALSDEGACTSLSGSPNNCDSGELAFWDLGDLPPGSGKTVYLTPTIANGASDGTLINFSANAFENGSLQATANQSIEVQSSQIFHLEINANQEPATINSELIYDIIFSHMGDIATIDTELRFPLPVGTNFISADGNGSLVGNDVVWDIGVLNPGQSDHRQIKLQLGASIGNGEILTVDSATITGVANFIPQQAQVVSTIRVDDSTKIAFALSINTNPIRLDEFVYAHLTVTNRTSQIMTGTRIELFYPNGLLPITDNNIFDNGDCTFVIGSPANCDSGETVFWDIGDLEPGVGKTVYIVPTLRSTNADGQMLPFFARAFTDNSGDHWKKRTLVVEENRLFNLSINAQQEPVAPNSQVVYDIVYSNKSSTATTGTQLKIPLPLGTSFVTADAGGSIIGNDILWDLGILNPGQVGHLRLTLQLDAGIDNGDIIVVDAATITGSANFITHQAIALTSTRVEDVSQLGLALVTNGNPIAEGEFIYTHLTVTNKTNAVMTGARLELFYPKGLAQTNNIKISDGGRCVNSFGCLSGNTVFWDLPNLNPGAGKTVYLTSIPLIFSQSGSSDGLLFPFIARAFADGTSEHWERNTIVFEEDRLLNLNVIAKQEPVAPNQQLIYDISYSNQSNVTTSNSELRFPLPDNTTLVSADAGGQLIGNNVIWDLGLLNPGQSAHRQVTVQLGASIVNGDIIKVDSVTITGVESFINHQTNAQASTRVEDAPAIGFAISTSTSPIRTDEFPYIHLTVTNKTAQLMTGVRVELLLPFGLNILLKNGLTDNGDCTSSGGICQIGETIFWELGSLGPGTGKTVSLTPTILPNLLGQSDGKQIPFFARAFADSRTDRWQRSTIIIEENRALSLAIDADQEPNIIDSSLSYNLTFGNRGNTAANDIELRFPLPSNSTFISAEADGTFVDNEVIWEIGRLNPGEGSTRRVTLQLDNSINAGDIIEIDKASISTIDQKTLSSSILRVKHNNVLDLWLDLDENVVLPNEIVDVNPSVGNQSGNIMPNVELSLFYPLHLNQLVDSSISNGGDCTNLAGSNFTCDVSETVIWNLGNMQINDTSLQNIPPTISQDLQNTFNGAVIQFYAKANNTTPDRSYISRSLLIGTFIPAVDTSDIIFKDGFD